MTAVETKPDETDQPTIPTTTVEVEGIGPVGEDQLADLTKALLEKVIRACNAAPPKKASRDELETIARNGLRLRAMLAAGAPVEETPAIDQPVTAPTHPEVEQARDVAAELERAPGTVVPDLSRWQMIQSLASYLFKSNLRPASLKNEYDVGMVLLAANDLGIPLTQAMQKIVVQNGRLSQMGELMSALILRDGHELRYDDDNDETGARVYGRRKDSQTWHSAQFTIEEAIHAGLCRRDGDGRVIARSDKGKALPWELYTSDMLAWRALARLARRHFSDCLGGVSYLPDELGFVDVEAVDELPGPGRTRAGESEPTMTLNEQRSEIARHIAELPEDLRGELRDEWKRRGLPKPDDLRPGAIRTARGLVEAAETKAQEQREAAGADIDEAELVEDEHPDGDARGDSTGEGDATDGETAPEPVDPSASPDDELTEFCAGCGERIGDDVNPVYDDDERPWHVECSPFT